MRLGSRLLAVEGEELMVRDPGLLQSALLRPQATVFGQDAYPSLFDKAAALIDSLANNHALIDGIKRLAWAGTKLFLLLNDRHLLAPSAAEGEDFVLGVTAHAATLDEIAATLERWSD